MTRSLILRSLEPQDFGRTMSATPEVTDLGEPLESDGESKARDVISLGL